MIRVQALNKAYGNNTIIDNSTFSIPGKSISFFMGPNGVGKTTLIKCLNNLEHFKGNIQTDSTNSLVIWDDTPFYKGLTGLRNLQIFCEDRCRHQEIMTIGQKYLTREILKNKVKSYSYGQKKRLSLILIEILKPDILYMDEITNGLDVDMIKKLKSSLAEWSEDMTIILMGHHLDFYEQVANHVFAIKDKKVTEVQMQEKGLEALYDEMS